MTNSVDFSGLQKSVDDACALIDNLREQRQALVDALSAVRRKYAGGGMWNMLSDAERELWDKADEALLKAQGVKVQP